MIKTESDVRAMVRVAPWAVGVKWIEHGMGGTPGLPDCFLPGEAGAIRWWMELKLGEVKGGRLRYEVRSAQRRELSELMTLNHVVIVGVGIKGTDQFVFVSGYSEGALDGDVDLQLVSAGVNSG